VPVNPVVSEIALRDPVAGAGGRIERAHFPAGTPIAAWKDGYMCRRSCRRLSVDVSVFDLVASGRYSSIGLADAPTCRIVGRRFAGSSFFSLLSVAERRRANCHTATAPRADCTRARGKSTDPAAR